MDRHKILLGLVIAVLVLQIVTLLKLYSDSALKVGTSISGPVAAGIVVGATPELVTGTVSSLNGNVLKLETPSGERSFAVPESVAVVSTDGTLKDQSVRDTDQDAYNARVSDLLKDPAKNPDELARLMPPSPFIETAIALAVLKPGDRVSVQVFGSGKTAEVLKIIRSTGADRTAPPTLPPANVPESQ